METDKEFRERLVNLLNNQQLGVLSTQYGGRPYANLVAFAATEDAKHLLFATTRATRKYANIESDSRVAMLIDNRSNKTEDFHSAMAVKATGKAEELGAQEREKYVNLYLRKHPHLRDFVDAPSCAFFRIRIQTYILVNRFQEVFELQL